MRNITKRQQIGIVVVGLALAGLMLDRTVLGGGPAKASASAAKPAGGAAGKAAKGNAAATGATATAGRRAIAGLQDLAKLLEATAAAQKVKAADVTDAFKPVAAWAGAPAEAPAVNKAQASAAQFVQKHRLSAIMRGPTGGSAIIGTKFVALGQRVDGYRLVTIGARSVTLDNGVQRVTLWLPADEVAVEQ